MKKLIIERTEGNPFFMEEIVQALFEQEALVRDGTVKVAKSLSFIQIPPTVQAVLASRIDRLAPGVKDLLSMLAVIGKEFPLGLVRHMAGKPDDELLQLLMVLQSAEFIYEQPAFPDVAYAFKHALSQQVAYGSTLQERRKILHKRIANVLEGYFPETVETQPELIGHHYTQAGLGAEAIPYWQQAGERALQRAANVEAISHLTRGLELLKPVLDAPERTGQKSADEGRRCALLLALGEAQKGVGAHLDAQETFVQAADIAQLLGSSELLVRAALDLAEMSADVGTSAAPSVRLLENASHLLGVDDCPLKVETLAGLAQALGATGVHQEAMEHALEAVAMARRLDEPELLAEGLVAALQAFQGPEHAEQRRAYASELL